MKHSFLESTEFRSQLLSWYGNYARRLPWRASKDPYEILVSELMLQQTQVATVLAYYGRWLGLFPNVRSLAEADEAAVLRAWQGLGYYQRARNLRLCARMIVDRFSGRFPPTVEELMQLPGIGRYTAGAIVSFAFDRPAPIVDVNVGRVLSRLTNLRQPIDDSKGRKLIWSLAERFASGNRPGLSNAALMELGATVCSARKPRCPICPVRLFCEAEEPESIPRRKGRTEIQKKDEDYFLAVQGDRILLERRTGRRWQGLWTLPALANSGSRNSERPLVCIRHPITRFIVRLSVFCREAPERLEEGQAWKSQAEIEELPMPTPHRKALNLLLRFRCSE